MVNPAIDQAVAAWKAGDREAGPMMVALPPEDMRTALAMVKGYWSARGHG